MRVTAELRALLQSVGWPHVDQPEWVAGAFALVLLAVGTHWWWHRRRLQRLAHLGGESAVTRLASADVRRAPRARTARVAAALGLAALAYAGPRWGDTTNVVRTEGIDVVLAMDASLSMLAGDERPSRLERMKQEIRRFRALAPGNRVALLAFAGRSYILSPLTADDGAIALFLDNLDPSVVGQPGSAMATTIRQGTDLLVAARGAAGRGLVILSDGEAFDDHDESLAAAKAAADAEIGVVTVGFGTTGGATIPVVDGTVITDKRDDNGEVVVSKHDPAFLEAVAKAGRGVFVPAQASDRAERILGALARLDARQRSVEEGRSRPLRVSWFLFPAVLLLLFDAWRADGGRATRVRRWLRLSGAAVALGGVARPLAAQSRDAGTLYTAGKYTEAVARLRQQMAEGDRRPVTLYNLGTALLAADSLAAAVEMLDRASLSADPALHRLALYNVGLAHLRRATRGEQPDPRELDAAIGAYRTLLLQQPGDRDATWNFELALRQKRQGGGGGNRQDPSRPSTSQPRAPQEPRRGMSPQQAEQLLAAAARDEKETQSRRQKGMRQERVPGAKDW